MNILVSGGAGYIGSHTIVELVSAGFTPIILDNFITSDHSVLAHLKAVTGQEITCIEGDYTDPAVLQNALGQHDIKAVVHFAALKAVGESLSIPLKYYRNNVSGFVTLVDAVTERGIPLVFSSSAAVYGQPAVESVTEETACVPESPYGWSKLMDEVVLQSACKATAPASGIALRYFNVVGAHDSGKLGEMPKLPPQNLLPIVVQAVAGIRPPVTVYGNDYETPDGTCQRDYVHVVDLAKAHVSALNHLLKQPKGYYDVFNVGTGQPTSVLELINAFEEINQIKVPYHIGPRRTGDPRACYANADKIHRILGWRAEKTIEDAVGDAWRWQEQLSKAGEPTA